MLKNPEQVLRENGINPDDVPKDYLKKISAAGEWTTVNGNEYYIPDNDEDDMDAEDRMDYLLDLEADRKRGLL